MINELRRCTRCVMPETWPGLTFNEEGICNQCLEFDRYVAIDWNARWNALQQLVATYKRRTAGKYQCLVGFSGGKDSTFTLYTVVKTLGLTPLVFTFNHGFPLTEEGESNLQIPERMGCDHVMFTLGEPLRNALCKLGSRVIGDFCYHCHAGVGAMPTRIASQWGIELQVWGEPTSLYQSQGNIYSVLQPEEQDYEHYLKEFVLGHTPEKMAPGGFTPKDLSPLTWPLGAKAKAIYLGNYIRWDQPAQAALIKRELGWRDYRKQETWQDFDKVDCPHETLREAQKKLRKGFGKASFAASKEIREGRITRKQGMALVKEYEGKELHGLDAMCGEFDMTWEQLKEITAR